MYYKLQSLIFGILLIATSCQSPTDIERRITSTPERPVCYSGEPLQWNPESTTVVQLQKLPLENPIEVVMLEGGIWIVSLHGGGYSVDDPKVIVRTHCDFNDTPIQTEISGNQYQNLVIYRYGNSFTELEIMSPLQYNQKHISDE